MNATKLKDFNRILLTYNQQYIVDGNTNKQQQSERVIQGLLADIAQLGYTLDGQLINQLYYCDDVQIRRVKYDLTNQLRSMIGANVKYVPLFKTFPDDVPDDEIHLMKRIVGFAQNYLGIAGEFNSLSCGHLIDPALFDVDEFGACPICQHKVPELHQEVSMPPLQDITPFRVITLGTENDVMSIVSNLLSSETSISEQDKQTITKVIRHLKDDSEQCIPESIPFKENIALVSNLLYEHCSEQFAIDYIERFVNTATDILRVAVAFCHGDISLAENCHFKFDNKQRRIILGLLDRVYEPQEDMLRHRMQWIRLGEVVHPHDKSKNYPKRFPNAVTAFDDIRNHANQIPTFNRDVEQLEQIFQENGTKKTLLPLTTLLKKRPGEFSRRLDMLMRYSHNPDWVVNEFEDVIHKVKTPTLMQIDAGFKYRSTPSVFRYYVPKGTMSKTQFFEGDDRKPINEQSIKKLRKTVESELIRRFGERESLGNVHINTQLANYLVPFSQRSASEQTMQPLTRGSAISFDDGKTNTVRMFVWWMESEISSRVDVDLSAIAYDENWDYKYHISYTNLSAIGGKHSGDILSAPAPDGASEFIDININKALKAGIRYISMNLLSYSRQPFDDFHCMAGVMMRQNASTGQHFDPRTVQTKYDVNGDSRIHMPMVFDLKERKMIWADFSLKGKMNDPGWNSYSQNNVESHSINMCRLARIANELRHTRPNLLDLFSYHAMARAHVITTSYNKRDDIEYDYVFDVDSAFDIDGIMGNWLT